MLERLEVPAETRFAIGVNVAEAEGLTQVTVVLGRWAWMWTVDHTPYRESADA